MAKQTAADSAESKRGQFTAANGWQTAKAFGVAIAGYLMAIIRDADPDALQRAAVQLGQIVGWPALPAVVIAIFEWQRRDR